MKKKVKKLRADQLAVQKELCENIELARKHILAGNIRIGSDQVIRNASEMIKEDCNLQLNLPCPYVSRGAYKLIPALDEHLSDLRGLTAMDVGASTGGFTDLMLQRGAKMVHTVDVGRGQLHQKLRLDPRVNCNEQVNARALEQDFIPEHVDVITMDVSFISVTKVLPSVNQFLKQAGYAFILVKPQFEAQKHEIMQGGVVVDEGIRQKYVDKIKDFAKETLNWTTLSVQASPIKGPKGNQEFLVTFKK